MIIHRQTCRACGSSALVPVLDLGKQVLASNFATSQDFPPVERPFPLALMRCDPNADEKACGLLQLTHTVPSDLMYAAYGYRSGINESMAAHLRSIAQAASRQVSLRAGDLVVDIGANDGTLLLAYDVDGVELWGFEPSDIRPEIPTPNIRFIHDYFSAATLREQPRMTRAKVITSIAMFYDLESPATFVADVAEMLHADGIWILELAYLPTMLTRNTFDTVCHEHLTYWSLMPLERLLGQHGLSVIDAHLNDINGGSIQVWAAKRGGSRGERTLEAKARIYNLKRQEIEMRLDEAAPYEAFHERVMRIQRDLPLLLKELKAEGKKVLGYGASTKGNVTLQYCGIGPEILPAIADRNPRKWGTKTPGSGIPIVSEEDMRGQKPDYLLALAWHFMPAFQKREHEFLGRGGRFIVPMPVVKVV